MADADLPARPQQFRRFAQSQVLKRFMQERGLGDQYCCPDLPHLPRRAIAVIETEIAKCPRASVTLVGSSLGG